MKVLAWATREVILGLQLTTNMGTSDFKRVRQHAGKLLVRKATQIPAKDLESARRLIPQREPPPPALNKNKPKGISMGFGQSIKDNASNWCLVAFTLVLAVVAVRQYDLADRQLSIMKVDQRAWVSVKVDDFPKTLTEGMSVGTEAHILNTGKTPAINVGVHLIVEKIRNGDAIDFNAGVGRFRDADLSGVYLPNTTRDMPLALYGPPPGDPVKLSQQDVDDLVAGRTFLAAFGEVDYTDMFGIPHWMRVCGWTSYNTTVTYSAYPCAAYNGIDSNR